jgi:hypothetical protein
VKQPESRNKLAVTLDKKLAAWRGEEVTAALLRHWTLYTASEMN